MIDVFAETLRLRSGTDIAISVLSLIILLALRSTCFSYKAMREDCLKPVILLLMFTTRCNLVFLTDVPKPTHKKSKHFSYKAVRQDCLKPVTTNVYNGLQLILVFLTDVPKPTHKRKCQNTLYTWFIKHGQNGAINLKERRC